MGWEVEDFSEIIDAMKGQRFYKTKMVLIVTVIVFVFILAGFSSVKLFGQPNLSFIHNNEVISVSDYKQFDDLVLSQVSEKYDEPYKLYDSSGLSIDIIESRKGEIIVERCVCYVDEFNANEGNGTILNAFDKDFSYIHFSNMGEEIHKGTIVVSYFIYNPDNNIIDDVSDIYDFVLTREYEEM